MQPTVQAPPVRSFVKNIAEAPVVQQPKTPAGVTVVTDDKKKKTSSKKLPPLKYILAGIVLLILGIGGTIGFLLSQQQQDVRQQASTPTGVAELFVEPATTTFTPGSTQTITFKVNMNVADKQIAGVQFIADMTGSFPTDLAFTPAEISGLNPVSQTIIDTTEGKQLTVGFLTVPPSTFTTTTNDLTLGTLTFTVPSSGSLTMTFDPALSKVIEVAGANTEDILHTPGSETYTFSSGQVNPTATPTQAVSLPTATPISSNTPTATPGGGGVNPTATMTPTATPTLPPGVTPTATPIPTATPTLAPGVTPSVTPTPTSTLGSGGGSDPTNTPTPTTSGDSSQPAQTQDTPVSGSAEHTLFLLLAGLGFTALGTIVWKRTS